MTDERFDRLLDALERFARGTVPRRYLVAFAGVYEKDVACVVEAFTDEEAVRSAQRVLYRSAHDPCLVRPAKDDDCLACGATTGHENTCEACGRTREQQTRFMHNPRFQ